MARFYGFQVKIRGTVPACVYLIFMLFVTVEEACNTKQSRKCEGGGKMSSHE